MTVWKDEESFTAWTKSQAFEKAHQERRPAQAGPSIFAGNSYPTKYQVINEK